MASLLSIANDNSKDLASEMSEPRLSAWESFDLHQFHVNMHLDLIELLFREPVRADSVNNLYSLPVFLFQSKYILPNGVRGEFFKNYSDSHLIRN